MTRISKPRHHPSVRAVPTAGGAFPVQDGVLFSVFAPDAKRIEIVLFDAPFDVKPSRTIALSPQKTRTSGWWNVPVPDTGPGQLYGYRAEGPFDPASGRRPDPEKILVDPYAWAVVGTSVYSRETAKKPGSNAGHALLGVVPDISDYDWEGDQPLQIPIEQTIIYECHVGAFTRHPSLNLPENKRGTFAGLVTRIPYLKDLGVTALELLPIQHFDEQDAPSPLKNIWGYSPVAFFAPHENYGSRSRNLSAVDEFREMVKAFHRAGIEIILDVVFNHTAESDETGPTLSFRGLADRAYYIRRPEDPSKYANYSGCGNTVNASHPVVRNLILDSLRYWVRDMHVDGFRFDLASALSRDEHGTPLKRPRLFSEIEKDPVLAGTKLIAEPWDAAGLYQVGSFPGERWIEWNDRFRDDVRRFVKGDPGAVNALASRIVGSPDIYARPDHRPHQSVHFVTCHDGFTLNDLVSYSQKHNRANLEASRDGSDTNLSWNCGYEGPSRSLWVEALRQRQIRNFLVLLFISHGTPMLLFGDEVRRTQMGNNNAYCQDNDLFWLNWSKTRDHAGILRFVRRLIALRKSFPAFSDKRPWTDPQNGPRIFWHGVSVNEPDWDADSHTLAFTLGPRSGKDRLHVCINAYSEPLTFEVPPAPKRRPWARIVDTSRESPDDFPIRTRPPTSPIQSIEVAARSIVVLRSVEVSHSSP